MENILIMFWYGFVFFMGASAVLTWDTLKSVGWGAPREEFISHIATNPTKGVVYSMSLLYCGAGYIGAIMGVYLYRMIVGKK